MHRGPLALACLALLLVIPEQVGSQLTASNSSAGAESDCEAPIPPTCSGAFVANMARSSLQYSNVTANMTAAVRLNQTQRFITDALNGLLDCVDSKRRKTNTTKLRVSQLPTACWGCAWCCVPSRFGRREAEAQRPAEQHSGCADSAVDAAGPAEAASSRVEAAAGVCMFNCHGESLPRRGAVHASLLAFRA